MKQPQVFTLRALLDESARRFSSRPALRWLDGREYSYRDVELGALQAAFRLAEMGLNKGDKVVILSESRPEWGIAYLGITSAGYVAVPILPDFIPAQIATIAKHSDCSAIVVSDKMAHKIDEDAHRLCPILDLGTLIADSESDSALDNNSSDQVPVSWDAFPQPSESDLAAILYTSGTTGRPKGVMLSHRALAFDAWATSSVVTIRPGDRLLSILPIAHSYECTVGFLTPFSFGASITYMDKPPSASVLLPAMKKLRPTMILSVPLVIEKIVRNLVFPKLAALHLPKAAGLRKFFKSLAVKIAGAKLRKTFGGKLWFFGVGGAALAPDVEQFLREAGFPYAIGYGMTETSPLIAGMHPRAQVYRATGLPVRGIQVRIGESRNEAGEGEIQVKGPIVMDGYYKEPGLTKECFTQDLWLKTGDLGAIDSKGQIYIRGRIKTMILGPSGENIYPEEIEALINSFDFVEESLVYGDEANGVTALVQLKGDILERLLSGVSGGVERLEGGMVRFGGEVKVLEEKAAHLIDALRKGVNEKLAHFARVKKVVIHTEPFEKTPSKKIKRDKYPQQVK